MVTLGSNGMSLHLPGPEQLITREAGKIVGKAGFSVKRPSITTIPANNNQPIIEGVHFDTLHGRMCIRVRLVEGSIEICAEFTGDKLAKGFKALAR